MKCARCGAENKPEAVSCWQCYASLTGSVPTSQAPPPPAQQPPPVSSAYSSGSSKKSPLIPIVALIVLVAGAAGGYVYMQGRNAPGKTVKGFLEAVGRSDWDGMAKYFPASTASKFQEAKQQVNQNPVAKAVMDSLKIENVEIVGTTIEGGKAKVKFKATVSLSLLGKSQSKTQEGEIPLMKENGEWKIDSNTLSGGLAGMGGMGG